MLLLLQRVELWREVVWHSIRCQHTKFNIRYFNHTKVTTTPVVTDIPADTGLEDNMVDLDVEDTNIDDFGDDNDLDFDDDDDDADIADLENFLSKSLKWRFGWIDVSLRQIEVGYTTHTHAHILINVVK